MKIKYLLLLTLVGMTLMFVGCISTVTGNKTAGVPWVTDRVEARYERSLDKVFNAAKDVVIRNGTISSAGTIFNQTNDVRVIEGKVRQNNVWIRIEAIDPKLTSLIVQTRTSGGGTDQALAHELDKEVALELAR